VDHDYAEEIKKWKIHLFIRNKLGARPGYEL